MNATLVNIRGTIQQRWGRFRYKLCLFFFKDIILEELTDAMHPDFGYLWREPDGEGYKYIEQARHQGWCEALDAVTASLRAYPHGGGHIDIMREVERLIGKPCFCCREAGCMYGCRCNQVGDE